MNFKTYIKGVSIASCLFIPFAIIVGYFKISSIISLCIGFLLGICYEAIWSKMENLIVTVHGK